MRLVSYSAVAALALSAACASAGGTAQPQQYDPAVPAKPNQVVIYKFIFTPKRLTVAPGTTVQWVNHDIAAHTATRNGGTDQFDSGNLSLNQNFTHTFGTTGVYNYICFYHPGMKAEIIVQ